MASKPQFGYHFAKLHRLMVSLSKEEIAGLGIQASAMPFLIALLRAGEPVTQDELSASLLIDKAATARALDRLEKKGFVARWVNPENRRQKLVSATPKARDIADRLFEILRAAGDIFTRDFSEEELTLVLNLMNRMIANAMSAKYDRKFQQDLS